MKRKNYFRRVLIFFTLFTLVACSSPVPTMLPLETSVYLTLQAEPKTDTPTVTPTASITPTPPSAATTQALAIDFNNMPGGSCLPTNTNRMRGLVTRVLSGDTIEIAIGNDAYQVRYIGIDAPGITPIEWQGPEAVNMNSRLVSGQFVTLIKDASEVDSSGALLRYVIANDVFVNYELLRLGLAKAVITPPDVACEMLFMGAQDTAKAASAGVWAPTPIPTPTITLTPTITPTPTDTLQPVCDCRRNYKCNDFWTQRAAQACYNYCTVKQGIFIGLTDNNGNGLVCEGLP